MNGSAMRESASRWICAWLLAAVCVSQGQYAMPVDTPGPIRRDLIPLEPCHMHDLATALAVVAASAKPEDAAARRAMVQCVALAKNLSPKDEAVEKMLLTLATGGSFEAPAQTDLEAAFVVLNTHATWLSSDAAGKHGQNVAACLTDVYAALSPSEKKPLAAEKGAWTGWVPPLSAYERKPTAEPSVEQPAPETAIKLTQASLTIAQRTNERSEDAEDARLKFQLITMGIKAEFSHPDAGKPPDESPPEKESPTVTFVDLPSGKVQATMETTGQKVADWLHTRHQNLPKSLTFAISCTDLEISLMTQKPGEYLAPAMVLTDAAIMGSQPRASLLAVADEKGALALPPMYWRQVGLYEKSKPKLLVVAPQATEVLPSLLVLEKPDFFFKTQVLVADDANEMCDLALGRTRDSTERAIELFRALQQMDRFDRSVRTLLADATFKARLLEVVRLSPQHFSAQALVRLADGKRPGTLARPVLAAELLANIEPLAAFSRPGPIGSTSIVDECRELSNSIRGEIEAWSRHADSRDRELIAATVSVLNDFRDIERKSRERSTDSISLAAFTSARLHFAASYKSLVTALERERDMVTPR